VTVRGGVITLDGMPGDRTVRRVKHPEVPKPWVDMGRQYPRSHRYDGPVSYAADKTAITISSFV
jgi:hypothetical protein